MAMEPATARLMADPVEQNGRDRRSSATVAELEKHPKWVNSPDTGKEDTGGPRKNGAVRPRRMGPGDGLGRPNGKPTADEQLLDRTMPVEPFPRAPELAAAVKTAYVCRQSAFGCISYP